ncbi:MAG: hypothetical protein EXR43_00855 [Dehalococcoidia bacterium]|nr:hypothetical protein [Dehalococcoidia bacterium]
MLGSIFTAIATKAAASAIAVTIVAGGGVGASAALGGPNLPGMALEVIGLHQEIGDSANDSDEAKVKAPTTAAPTLEGRDVSSAVHDAIASTMPGRGRGEAVSKAACTAAHDGERLLHPSRGRPIVTASPTPTATVAASALEEDDTDDAAESEDNKDCEHPNRGDEADDEEAEKSR